MKTVVYIIDDNMVSEFATKMVLQQSTITCELFSFDSAEMGLANFIDSLQKKQNIPDIILLDLNMPGMDGWEFLSRLKKIKYPRNKVAIYVLSTFTSAMAREKARSHELVSGLFERPLSKINVESILSEKIY
ncbi:response regulator [uncultured Kriegella sp.]|uniref:response regulator n=1 Tax=uncultured Kriegella sp. TaxID=1798910 RepID=UPI0030DC5497|tara:strand:- start:25220 stop:25615 length:396 start_codon:yes stop_codon:yes gene_type:complete